MLLGSSTLGTIVGFLTNCRKGWFNPRKADTITSMDETSSIPQSLGDRMQFEKSELQVPESHGTECFAVAPPSHTSRVQ